MRLHKNTPIFTNQFCFNRRRCINFLSLFRFVFRENALFFCLFRYLYWSERLGFIKRKSLDGKGTTQELNSGHQDLIKLTIGPINSTYHFDLILYFSMLFQRENQFLLNNKNHRITMESCRLVHVKFIVVFKFLPPAPPGELPGGGIFKPSFLFLLKTFIAHLSIKCSPRNHMRKK